MDDNFLLSVIGNENSEDILCLDKFIGDNILENLIIKLKCTPKVQKKRLILRGNCITSIGVHKLANFLKSNNSLQFISLEWNQIGSGAMSLGEALEENTTLVHLDLRNNGLEDNDVINLAKSLENSNKTLKILDLRWNKLTDKGVELFRLAIMNRSPPLIVHFSGNHLSPQVMNQVDDWLIKMDKHRQSNSSSSTQGSQLLTQSSQQSFEQGGSNSPFLMTQTMMTNQSSNDNADNTDDENDYLDSDLISQNRLIMQLKLKHSLLKKEIQTMRHQNIYLQTSIRSLENQLCSDSLHVTEVEANLVNETFKNTQLSEIYAQSLEKISKLETERRELLSNQSEVIGKKDHEIKTLFMEKNSYKNMIERSEVSEE